jgi:hypothetical protein
MVSEKLQTQFLMPDKLSSATSHSSLLNCSKRRRAMPRMVYKIGCASGCWKAGRQAAQAFEKEQSRRERERQKEEAAAAKQRERRERAIEKAQAALVYANCVVLALCFGPDSFR